MEGKIISNLEDYKIEATPISRDYLNSHYKDYEFNEWKNEIKTKKENINYNIKLLNELLEKYWGKLLKDKIGVIDLWGINLASNYLEVFELYLDQNIGFGYYPPHGHLCIYNLEIFPHKITVNSNGLKQFVNEFGK